MNGKMYDKSVGKTSEHRGGDGYHIPKSKTSIGADGDGKGHRYSSQNAVKHTVMLDHSNGTGSELPGRFTKAVHGKVV